MCRRHLTCVSPPAFLPSSPSKDSEHVLRRGLKREVGNRRVVYKDGFYLQVVSGTRGPVRALTPRVPPGFPPSGALPGD